MHSPIAIVVAVVIDIRVHMPCYTKSKVLVVWNNFLLCLLYFIYIYNCLITHMNVWIYVVLFSSTKYTYVLRCDAWKWKPGKMHRRLSIFMWGYVRNLITFITASERKMLLKNEEEWSTSHEGLKEGISWEKCTIIFKGNQTLQHISTSHGGFCYHKFLIW